MTRSEIIDTIVGDVQDLARKTLNCRKVYRKGPNIVIELVDLRGEFTMTRNLTEKHIKSVVRDITRTFRYAN